MECLARSNFLNMKSIWVVHWLLHVLIPIIGNMDSTQPKSWECNTLTWHAFQSNLKNKRIYTNMFCMPFRCVVIWLLAMYVTTLEHIFMLGISYKSSLASSIMPFLQRPSIKVLCATTLGFNLYNSFLAYSSLPSLHSPSMRMFNGISLVLYLFPKWEEATHNSKKKSLSLERVSMKTENVISMGLWPLADISLTTS